MGELQPGLDTAPIRMVEHPLVGLRIRSRPVRPRVTCQGRLFPAPRTERVEIRTAGMVVFNHVWVNPDYYMEDYLAGYPQDLNLLAAMYFAHEMTHIWQWQTRETTGYHPLLGASEHWVSQDPYLFDPNDERDFLDYGYEQQASLVEEYICCRAMDPHGPRTARIEALLAPHMELTPIRRLAHRARTLLPQSALAPEGLCS